MKQNEPYVNTINIVKKDSRTNMCVLLSVDYNFVMPMFVGQANRILDDSDY